MEMDALIDQSDICCNYKPYSSVSAQTFWVRVSVVNLIFW